MDMNVIFKPILYFIISDYKKQNNEFISLLGMGNHNNDTTNFNTIKHSQHFIENLSFSPSLIEFLKKYVDESKINNVEIHKTLQELLENKYIESSPYDQFSFKITSKGMCFIFDEDLSRDEDGI